MDIWVWALFFLFAAVLFAVLEVFVPSGGILAFLSAIAVIGSVILVFQSGFIFGGVYLFCLAVGVPAFLCYAIRFWPRTMVGRRILLHPEEDPALQPNAELSARKQLIGKRGVARSKMVLSGLIEVEGKQFNAVSEFESLEPGDIVVVVKVDGIGVTVRKTTPETIKTETETKSRDV
jgi:membrane-bound serine protease (ClpP class)